MHLFGSKDTLVFRFIYLGHIQKRYVILKNYRKIHLLYDLVYNANQMSNGLMRLNTYYIVPAAHLYILSMVGHGKNHVQQSTYKG